jgi:hypothetical protein
MAAQVSIQDNSDRHAKRVGKLVAATTGDDQSALGGVWQWINGVASGVSHFIGTTVLGGFKVIMQHLENLDHAVIDELKAISRIVFWIDILFWRIITRWRAAQQKRTDAQISQLRRYLIGVIYVSTQTVLTVALRATATERRHRIRDVERAETRARERIKALHGTIEREASSGYRLAVKERASTIIRLLDFAATRQPEIRALVTDVADGLLDLLSVEDPVLRITLGFIIKQIVDRLGIDKLVGTLIDDLLAPILGGKRPTDLHGVMSDVSQRLNALESQQATFMQNGGSQVEQAGDDWKNITSTVSNLAIVAFVAQGVVDPDTWAREINDTIGTAANDLVTQAAELFKGL